MGNDTKYGSLRLKEDTLDYLRDLKEAYELTYGHPFTYDEFVRAMTDSIDDGDPAVWEMFCLRRQQKEEAEKKAKELRENKDKENQ